MASIEHSEHGMPKQSGVADLIVKGAIALVTAAFFIGAYLQFQLSFWLALIAALSVYIMLLMVHALRRRSERETELVSEVTRLEDEVARLQVGDRPVEGMRKDRAPTYARPGCRQRRHPRRLRPQLLPSLRPPPAPAPLANAAPPVPPPTAANPPRIFRNAPPVRPSASRRV